MAGAPAMVDGSWRRLVGWKAIGPVHMMVPAARPGAPRAALAAPEDFQHDQPLEIRISAWVFRRGGGAAAGCGALRPPRPHPCWQSVVAAPLSGPLPRIPGRGPLRGAKSRKMVFDQLHFRKRMAQKTANRIPEPNRYSIPWRLGIEGIE
jgi:hypothetical protein